MVKKGICLTVLLVGLFYVVTPVLISERYYCTVISSDDNVDQESPTEKEGEKEDISKKEYWVNEVGNSNYLLALFCECRFYMHRSYVCLIGYGAELLRPPECA